MKKETIEKFKEWPGKPDSAVVAKIPQSLRRAWKARLAEEGLKINERIQDFILKEMKACRKKKK